MLKTLLKVLKVFFVSLAFLASIAIAFSQTYPTPPNATKIASVEADIPHTLQACNITATTAAELTSALTSVTCGQTICLAAQSTGASFSGRFTWTKDCYPNFVTLRTTRASELPVTTRIKPSDAPKLAKLLASTAAGPIIAQPNSSGLRMIGLETTSIIGNNNLIVLGSNNSNPTQGPLQTTIASIPKHFVIDRCWVHGAPTKAVSAGIRIDADYVAVVNSHVDEIHDGGGDDQAIIIINAQGPFIFRNNFLEAPGENVMFGGGDTAIRLVPSDVLIMGNHFWKNPAKRFGDPLYKVKNLFELKSARRLRIVGNVFENFWSGVQSQYYAIVFKSANQGNCGIKHDQINLNDNGYYGQSADVEMAYNKLINIPQGFVFARKAVCPIEVGSDRYYVHDNLIEGLGSGHTQNGTPHLSIWSYPQQLNGVGEYLYPRNIIFAHNTVGSITGFGIDAYQYTHLETQGNYTRDFYLHSNIMPGRWAAAASTGGMTLNNPTVIQDRFRPALVSKNNLAISNSGVVFASAPNFSRTSYTGLFVNSGGGDFTLTSASAAAYPGMDGRPAGANIPVLNKCVAGATTSWTGVCPGFVDPCPGPDCPDPDDDCPTQSVILSKTSIKTGSNSVATAPPGWYGGTMSSSDTTKATLHPLPHSIGYMATGKATGSSSITGTNWTTAAGVGGCSLAASPLTITAPGTEILVFDWNEGIQTTSGRNIEGTTSSKPNNQPVRYNVDWTQSPNFAGGTYHGRVFQGCQAANEEWTWQINHWKGVPEGSGGELFSNINSTDLHFIWSGTPILRTFSIPLADFIDLHDQIPSKPVWSWTTPRSIMGFMPNNASFIPPHRQLDNAVYPMDLRFQIVNVAPGGTFSGWPAWTTNGIGERTYDCSAPVPVTITTPLNGATVTSLTTISVNASDNVGISKVEILVDNVIKATDNLSPYSTVWDASTVSNGSHQIVARAYDLAGNTNSHTINVTKGSGPTLSVTLLANGSAGPITVTPGSAGGPPAFSQQTIDETADLGIYEGIHHWYLSDINHDGKLDFSGAFGMNRTATTTQPQLVWYQYQTPPGRWTKRVIATSPAVPISALEGRGAHSPPIRVGALDGFTFQDKIYLNRSNGTDWTSPITYGTSGVNGHDVTVADIDEDGKEDFVYLNSTIKVGWLRQTSNPAVWNDYDVDTGMNIGPTASAAKLYSGIPVPGICDVDGDGHLDLIAAGRWYENPLPTPFGAAPGTPWTKHWLTTTGTSVGMPLIGQIDPVWANNPIGAKSVCADMDLDGDNDIVQSEEDIHPGMTPTVVGGARVGWLENLGGGTFGTTVHWIKTGTCSAASCSPREATHHDYHSLGVFDYDGDGDKDVVVADGNLIENNDTNKAIYVMENTRQLDGDKRPIAGFWSQHQIKPGGISAVCHQIKTGDVDGDGKIDMVCLGHKYKEEPGADAPFIFYKNTTVSGSVKLDWAVTGATKCEASASTPYATTLWSGPKNASGGTQTINPTSSATYTISCTNGSSTVNSSVTVNVSSVCAYPAL